MSVRSAGPGPFPAAPCLRVVGTWQQETDTRGPSAGRTCPRLPAEQRGPGGARPASRAARPHPPLTPGQWLACALRQEPTASARARGSGRASGGQGLREVPAAEASWPVCGAARLGAPKGCRKWCWRPEAVGGSRGLRTAAQVLSGWV